VPVHHHKLAAAPHTSSKEIQKENTSGTKTPRAAQTGVQLKSRIWKIVSGAAEREGSECQNAGEHTDLRAARV